MVKMGDGAALQAARILLNTCVEKLVECLRAYKDYDDFAFQATTTKETKRAIVVSADDADALEAKNRAIWRKIRRIDPDATKAADSLWRMILGRAR